MFLSDTGGSESSELHGAWVECLHEILISVKDGCTLPINKSLLATLSASGSIPSTDTGIVASTSKSSSSIIAAAATISSSSSSTSNSSSVAGAACSSANTQLLPTEVSHNLVAVLQREFPLGEFG